MKKLLLIFGLLVMLCGGTVSALKFLKLGPFQGEEIVEEKPEEQVEATILFVDMEPLAIPIFQGNRVAATVQIEVKLVTNGKDNVERIKQIMPVITNAFVRDLHSFMPRLLKAEERIDALIIKQRLQLISNKVAGKGLIKNVLVQSVIVQPR
jgi:flagellar basal body-associated protein FliL